MRAVTSSGEASEARLTGLRRVGRAAAASPAVRQLALLACYLAAGIAVTWPRATWLAEGKLPATRDGGSYVWGFWWVLHQVEHLGDPWFTRSIAAPAGAELGYHALMPLEGLVMTPVTLAFGPSASYNVLSIILPGLFCYAMYRAARLWLRTQAGAIAAGGFFGLSSMLTWQAWYLLNVAVGLLFLPLALEAAVRLRRRPGPRQAVILGLVLAAALLTDQQSAVLAVILAVLVLVPWLVARPRRDAVPGDPAGGRTPTPASKRDAAAGSSAAGGGTPTPASKRDAASGGTVGSSTAGGSTGGSSTVGGGTVGSRTVGGSTPTWARKLAVTATAAAVALVAASPQIVAMVVQSRSGGASFPQWAADVAYVKYSANLGWMFGVSPRAVDLGLTALKPVSYPSVVNGDPTLTDGIPTFGLVLTVLAVSGLVVSRRRRSAWLLALLWAGGAALALGPTLKIGSHVYAPAAEVWPGGVRVSAIMPYTWFVRIPGLAGFREAARILPLAIVPAALLAGAAVDWLWARARVLIAPVLILGVLEAGWGGTASIGTMPTALPRLDAPIAADRSGSLVVDVPFGIRGGIRLPDEGAGFDPEAQVLATADGHPRAVAYLSRIPPPTLAATMRHAFYAGLLSAEGKPRSVAERLAHLASYPALLAAARRDAQGMDVGWVVVWQRTPAIARYLARTGFRFDYAADGALVYRPTAR